MISKDLLSYKTTDALSARIALYKNIVGSIWLNKLVEYLHGFEGMEILDAGCGNGEIAKDVLEACPRAHLVGVDRSSALLDEARARCKGMSADFIEADLMEFASEKAFDRILLCHTLHLLKDPVNALSYILSLAKPEGFCVLTVHSDEDFPKRREWIKWFEQTCAKTYSASRDALTIEKWKEIFGDRFAPSQQEVVTSMVHLSDPQPYLAYIQTERHRFTPEPTEEEWQAYLAHAEDEIKKDIDRQGFFEEPHVIGILVVTK